MGTDQATIGELISILILAGIIYGSYYIQKNDGQKTLD